MENYILFPYFKDFCGSLATFYTTQDLKEPFILKIVTAKFWLIPSQRGFNQGERFQIVVIHVLL